MFEPKVNLAPDLCYYWSRVYETDYSVLVGVFTISPTRPVLTQVSTADRAAENGPVVVSVRTDF